MNKSWQKFSYWQTSVDIKRFNFELETSSNGCVHKNIYCHVFYHSKNIYKDKFPKIECSLNDL